MAAGTVVGVRGAVGGVGTVLLLSKVHRVATTPAASSSTSSQTRPRVWCSEAGSGSSSGGANAALACAVIFIVVMELGPMVCAS